MARQGRGLFYLHWLGRKNCSRAGPRCIPSARKRQVPESQTLPWKEIKKLILSGDPAQPSGVWVKAKRSCPAQVHSATSALETEVAGSPSSEPKEKRWRSLNPHPESPGSLGWTCLPMGYGGLPGALDAGQWCLSSWWLVGDRPVRSRAGDAHFGMEPLVRSRRRPGQGKLFHGVAQAWGVRVWSPIFLCLLQPPPPRVRLARGRSTDSMLIALT